MTDHFTRFAQAYATRTNKGIPAADKIFNHFIMQYGFPTRIHHDQGQEFNSTLFKELHRLTGIWMSNTTPYHPEGDGQCERLNRTVLNMLRSIPETEKGNWLVHLPKLMFAYNATIHKATNFSPFFLLFGREPRLPIDDVFPDVSSPAPEDSTYVPVHQSSNRANRETFGKFVRTWNDRMNEAFKIANENIGKSSGYNKNKHDMKAKCVEIVSGARVVVRNVRPEGTTRKGKLASYWHPDVYEVIEKLQGIPVYVLREWGTKKKTRVLHRNLLKKVNELAPVPTTPSVPSTPVVSSAKGPKLVKVPKQPRSKIPVRRSPPSPVLSRPVHEAVSDTDSDSESDVIVVYRTRSVTRSLLGGRDMPVHNDENDAQSDATIVDDLVGNENIDNTDDNVAHHDSDIESVGGPAEVTLNEEAENILRDSEVESDHEDVMRDSEVESDHGDGDMEGYDGEIDEDVVSLVSEESYHSVHSNPSIEVDGSNPFEVDGSNPSIEVDGSNPSAVDPSTILDSHDASDGSDNSLDLEDDVDTEQARRT